MSWFSIGKEVTTAALGVANIVDKFVETDDEKRVAETLRLKMVQNSMQVQAEINKIEAGSRRFWQSGWRPAVGWICVIGLANHYIAYPYVRVIWPDTPVLEIEGLMSLVVALLGLGVYRTVEKINGKAK